MEELEVTIKMKTGKMFMRNSWASVRDEENNVIGGIGASAADIQVEVLGKTYSITGKDLWDAVVKKLGRNDLAFEK